MSYRAPAFDDMRPLERQLAAARDRRTGYPRRLHPSAARLPFDGALAGKLAGFSLGLGDSFGDAFGDTPFGDVSAWNYPTFHTLDANEVYVVRLKCTGLPLADGGALLLFVRALGVSQTLGFDIRGACAWQDPGAASTAWWIDLVCTVSGWEGNPIPFLGNDAASIAAKIQNDPTLRQSFPGLQIDQSASLWGELTGPAQAIDFWKSQPLLWDHNLPGPKCVAVVGGCGGPTNTFANPPASSIVKGKADDGALATPFAVTAVPPIVAPAAPPKTVSWGAVGVVGGLVIAVALGYYLYAGKGRL